MSLNNRSTESEPSSLFSSKDYSKLSNAELSAIETRARQESANRQNPLKHLEFKTKTNDPVYFVTLSDMHIGSDATDYERLEKIKKQVLENDNTFIYLLGDEIEGRKPEYLTTNMEQSKALKKQVKDFQSFLKPLYDAGKIVCMVGEYFGHVGWAADKAGVDAWEYILGDMVSGIPIVQNNATVEVVYPNNHRQKFQVMHDPGLKSRTDELRGVRIIANREESDVTMRGHLHDAGVGVENDGKNKKSKVLVGGGTFKGTNRDLPGDKLGIRKAMPEPAPGAQSVIAMPRTQNQEMLIQPFMDFDQGLWTHAALELWDRAESQGITEELIQEARQGKSTGEMRIVTNRSRKDGSESLLDKSIRKRTKRRLDRLNQKNKANGKNGNGHEPEWHKRPYVAAYNTLGLQADLDLPISIEPLANLRLGADSSRRKDFAQHIKDIAGDPYRKALWLRKLIDPEVGKLSVRDEILDELLGYMNQLSKDQNIALLLDGSLSHDNWKKEIVSLQEGRKGKREWVVESEPKAPGSYLARESGMPLVNNQATIDMVFNLASGRKAQVPMVVWDHLVHRGATAKATYGLRSLYEDGMGGRPWLSVGGHMPGSGWSSMYDESNAFTKYPVFLAPGNWSLYTGLSKSNKMEGGQPGPSLIVVPKEDDVMILPVHSFDQRQTMMDAATLQVSLEKSGKRDEVMSRKKTPRRKSTTTAAQ